MNLWLKREVWLATMSTTMAEIGQTHEETAPGVQVTFEACKKRKVSGRRPLIVTCEENVFGFLYLIGLNARLILETDDALQVPQPEDKVALHVPIGGCLQLVGVDELSSLKQVGDSTLEFWYAPLLASFSVPAGCLGEKFAVTSYVDSVSSLAFRLRRSSGESIVARLWAACVEPTVILCGALPGLSSDSCSFFERYDVPKDDWMSVVPRLLFGSTGDPQLAIQRAPPTVDQIDEERAVFRIL
jgi:hypothetical protein